MPAPDPDRVAEVSVTQWNGEDQTAQGDDWEEQSCLEGCAYAREQARRRLKAPDDELLRRKPRGLRVEGFRERTLVTRFGEVAVRRRMYSVWEGVSLGWGRQYALAEVKLFVVGGDGANRIRRGVEELGSSRRAVFQLDGFHPSRAYGRGYGREIGSAIYDAIRSGSHGYARALMSAAEAAEGKTAIRNREYVRSNVSIGVDWRSRVPNAPPDARSLGTMESNGDKLTANRMKKRGMSWTILGAHRMDNVVQLKRNGELSGFCRRRRREDRHRTHPSAHRHSDAIHRTRVSDWGKCQCLHSAAHTTPDHGLTPSETLPNTDSD